MRPGEPTRLEIHLPTSTIVKVLLTLLLVWASLRLWPEFVLFSIAVLLAVTLDPAVDRMTARGLSRGFAILLIAFAMVGLAVLLIGLVLPPLGEQVTKVIGDFDLFRHRVEQRLPANYPFLKKVVAQIFELPSSPDVAAKLKQPLAWGRAAVSGLTAFILVIVLTLYLLLDGKRLYAWLLAFVPRRHRERLAETMQEVSAVVHAYVRAQVLTALLFTIFTAAVLSVFRVPAMVPLAVIAGICDVVPVLGIIIATLPAVMMALTVSPVAAGAVMLAYLLYHVFESYFLLPRIYGTRLRLSTLAVLLALIVGGTLQGIVGVVIVLPLVAAYPIVERIWLTGYLRAEVLKDHTALARAAEAGDEEVAEQVVETVLQGEKHPWEGPTKPNLGAPTAASEPKR
jgi:predicted PurR-regulated permease PerM